jgi:hypothetical protein
MTMPRDGHNRKEQNDSQGTPKSIKASEMSAHEKLVACKKRLARFEKQNGMDTDTFLRLFQAGQLGDDADLIEWEHFAYLAVIL